MNFDDLEIVINMSNENDFCFRFYINRPSSRFDPNFPYSCFGYEQGLKLISNLCKSFINEKEY